VFIEPCLALPCLALPCLHSPADRPRSGAGWIHEIKLEFNSAKRRQQGRRTNALWWQRFVFLDNRPRNEPNKIEHEPTKYCSRCYGNGYLIPVFHGIERIFSHSSWSDALPS
jgi:hypothetical protein